MGRKLIAHVAALAAVAALIGTGLGGPARAQTFEAGPSRAVIAGFETGSFYGEIVAVQSTRVSDVGVDGGSYGCVVFGSTVSRQQDEACGPMTIELDPLLDTGRVTATLDSLLGTITLDVTVVATGAPQADVQPHVTSVEATFGAVVSRAGEASGTIGSTGVGQNEGSSWYGQLTQQAKGRVALP